MKKIKVKTFRADGTYYWKEEEVKGEPLRGKDGYTVMARSYYDQYGNECIEEYNNETKQWEFYECIESPKHKKEKGEDFLTQLNANKIDWFAIKQEEIKILKEKHAKEIEEWKAQCDILQLDNKTQSKSIALLEEMLSKKNKSWNGEWCKVCTHFHMPDGYLNNRTYCDLNIPCKSFDLKSVDK